MPFFPMPREGVAARMRVRVGRVDMLDLVELSVDACACGSEVVVGIDLVITRSDYWLDFNS